MTLSLWMQTIVRPDWDIRFFQHSETGLRLGVYPVHLCLAYKQKLITLNIMWHSVANVTSVRSTHGPSLKVCSSLCPAYPSVAMVIEAPHLVGGGYRRTILAPLDNVPSDGLSSERWWDHYRPGEQLLPTRMGQATAQQISECEGLEGLGRLTRISS